MCEEFMREEELVHSKCNTTKKSEFPGVKYPRGNVHTTPCSNVYSYEAFRYSEPNKCEAKRFNSFRLAQKWIEELLPWPLNRFSAI